MTPRERAEAVIENCNEVHGSIVQASNAACIECIAELLKNVAVEENGVRLEARHEAYVKGRDLACRDIVEATERIRKGL